MPRLKALDGLRALAVVAVLASHTLNIAHGGFLGVDVFFVLSGYLITSLMIREHETTGRIDFAGFYRRRAARLIPAYLFMLVITIPFIVGPAHLVGRLPWPVAVASTALYAANWAQAADVDNLGPFLHTWSLSVEEQFYLLWPIAFVVLSRRAHRMVRRLGVAVVAVVVARMVGFAVHPGIWPYFATITHSDGLLVGALLAVLLAWRTNRSAGRRASRRADVAPTLSGRLGGERPAAFLAWGGGALIALAMLALNIPDPGTMYAGLTLSAVASALMVRHLVLSPDGVMSRVLSLGPLVAVGRVSYGLYLYHMPFFLWMQRLHRGMAQTLVAEVGATVVVTVFSWFTIERPAQRWVARRWPRGTPSRAERAPAAPPAAAPPALGYPAAGYPAAPGPFPPAVPRFPARQVPAAVPAYAAQPTYASQPTYAAQPGYPARGRPAAGLPAGVPVQAPSPYSTPPGYPVAAAYAATLAAQPAAPAPEIPPYPGYPAPLTRPA